MIKIHVGLVYRRVLSLLPIYCLVAHLPKKIDETHFAERAEGEESTPFKFNFYKTLLSFKRVECL